MSKRIRILVADDDPQVRLLITTVLESEDLEVVAVADGAEALAQVGASHFDGLVLDGQMPGHGGLDVVKQVRLEGREIPAVIVSAARELEAEAIQVGAAFLSKPFAPVELLRAVRKQLGPPG